MPIIASPISGDLFQQYQQEVQARGLVNLLGEYAENTETLTFIVANMTTGEHTRCVWTTFHLMHPKAVSQLCLRSTRLKVQELRGGLI